MDFVYSIRGSLCGYFRGPTTSTLRRAKNWEIDGNGTTNQWSHSETMKAYNEVELGCSWTLVKFDFSYPWTLVKFDNGYPWICCF
jgi:hypothetical protein